MDTSAVITPITTAPLPSAAPDQRTWPIPSLGAGAAQPQVSVHLTDRGRARVNAPQGRPLHEDDGQPEVTVERARLVRPRRAPQGAFRHFEADVESRARASDVDMVIGTISGTISWLAWLPELVDEHHPSPVFAELIAAAADVGDRLNAQTGSPIKAVVMIDRVWLQPAWSGHLGRRIGEQLIDLFLLTPESTLVLIHLGPDADPGCQPAPAGGDDPSTSAREETGTPAGFERWRTSSTWWMRPDSACQLP